MHSNRFDRLIINRDAQIKHLSRIAEQCYKSHFYVPFYRALFNYLPFLRIDLLFLKIPHKDKTNKASLKCMAFIAEVLKTE